MVFGADAEAEDDVYCDDIWRREWNGMDIYGMFVYAVEFLWLHLHTRGHQYLLRIFGKCSVHTCEINGGAYVWVSGGHIIYEQKVSKGYFIGMGMRAKRLPGQTQASEGKIN